MVDNRVAGAVEPLRQMRFGHGKADGVGHTLPQRTGAGLHAAGVLVLGVSWG